ncbi:14728_t:CDS:2 [Funneliformis geosporum]|nr:14728_t:CDS:2 [Funneliformis geosporum]
MKEIEQPIITVYLKAITFWINFTGFQKFKMSRFDDDIIDLLKSSGGRNAKDCTLVLTEGDTAKILAVAGLSEVGNDNYGIFPLRITETLER